MALLFPSQWRRAGGTAPQGPAPPPSSAPQEPARPWLWSSFLLDAAQTLNLETPTQPQRLPIFRLRDPEGNETPVQELSGKPLVINFWATWCMECQKELPHWQKLWDKAQQDGDWALVLINWGEDPVRGQRFLERNGYTIRTFVDPKKRIGERFGVTGVPETYIVTPDGYIFARAIGSREWSSEAGIQLVDALRMGFGPRRFPPQEPALLDAQQLQKMWNQEGHPLLLLDTRQSGPELLRALRMPGDVLLQHATMLPYDFALVVIADADEESRRIASELAAMGFPAVFAFQGAIPEWLVSSSS